MKVGFARLARDEYNDAVSYYDLKRPGLGHEFKTEVRMAIERMKHFPLAWPLERGEIHKCLVHRFPYKLLYAVEAERLLIVAVAHQHRQPDYWADRTR